MMSEEILHKIARDVGECNGKIDALCERIDRHEYTLFGNGTPGLAVRVDRVEQTAKRAAKGRTAFWGAIVSVIGAVVGGVAQLFGGR